MDAAAAADRVIAAYNAADFETLESLMVDNLDFAHYNRNFAVDNRDALLELLRLFANELLEWRRFEPPDRVTSAGNVCVRENGWIAMPKVDIEGLGAKAGTTFAMRLCTVMRFDDAGILVEWKDHG
jgi:hypothetical protein